MVLDVTLDVKKWTMDKVILELGKKLEEDNEIAFKPSEDELRLWNTKDRTQILKGKLGVTSVFSLVSKELVEVRFVTGTVAK